MRQLTRAAVGFAAALLLWGCASSAVRVRTPADFAELSDEMAQRYTMLEMLRVAAANAAARIDTGDYAASLTGLARAGYLETAIDNDAWGNAFVYTTGADTYTITSLGSDGAAGPGPPPVFWELGEAAGVDIMLTDGVFTQNPGFGR